MKTEPAIILSGTDPELPREVPRGLGRYTGFREMSRGGSGLLRSCFDPVTGRTVVVKTLLQGIRGDHRERRRLLREARVTAHLQHPNTVPVYDIGDDASEGIYFTMKRISGENLFEILKRIARNEQATIAAFPVSRRLQIVMAACQALSYAHARGVIHRDLKPENIWVGNFGEVVLLDWGVAKVWGHADHHETMPERVVQDPGSVTQDPANRERQQGETLTGGGQRPGTPLYMSPEQVNGSRVIDERTDIFSAGVCLYEVLAIREPFRGADISETFRNIRQMDVQPPSQRSPERGISSAADAVVLKALQKQPRNRYQSMRELISEIHDLEVQTSQSTA